METLKAINGRRAILRAALLALPVWSLGLAQGALSEPERLFHGVGVVITVDPAGGRVTVRHEAIEGLMPAMEMAFEADPPSIVRDVKAGDSIAFDLTGGTYTIKALTIRTQGGK